DGAVLEGVMIGGLEPDAAEVGDERRGVQRVGVDEAGGQHAPGIEPADDAHAQAERRRRQAEEGVDLALDGRLPPRAPLAERGPDAFHQGGQGLGGLEADLRREDRRVALEALLGAERQPDATPIVDAAPGDEAVEPRELRQRRADGAQHEVKERHRALGRPAGVQLGEEPLGRRGVDVLLEEDEGAVLRRQEKRHDPPERMDGRRRAVGAREGRHQPATARRPSTHRSALRSAVATMVSCGFTPIDEGSRLASATTSPSVPHTLPLASVAPRRGSLAMRAVPMMWTVMSSMPAATRGRSWMRRSWSGPESSGRSAKGRSTRRAPAAKSSSGGTAAYPMSTPSARKWWMWKAWCVPIHGSRRSSKTPTTLAFGCVWSPRPMARARSQLRLRMPGVWRAPAASTTSGARARKRPRRRPSSPMKRPRTPVARAPRKSTRSTRAWVTSAAPAARARGISVTCIACLAPVGQPNAQLLSPTQRRMLRGARATGQPRRRAPSRKSRVLPPKVSSWFGSACRMRSAAAKYGSIACGPVASSPRLRSQWSSTRSGVRQVMPPLITVEPPTHFPSAKMMPGLPKIIVVPASR